MADTRNARFAPSKETLIAGFTLVAIFLHVALKYAFHFPSLYFNLPLFAALLVGGVPMVWELLNKLWLARAERSARLGRRPLQNYVALTDYGLLITGYFSRLRRLRLSLLLRAGRLLLRGGLLALWRLRTVQNGVEVGMVGGRLSADAGRSRMSGR
jgi:hypothetical protein